MNRYLILGLMSGTSLDGLDMALCEFSKNEQEWESQTINCCSVDYPNELVKGIKNATMISSSELLILDKKLGRFYAEQIQQFLSASKIDPKYVDLIVSHGQTIFHQPENGFTYQIGCGETISYLTGIKVLNDVRQKDVVAGGQGAPLVPIGEIHLFKEFSAFLNIGGFCNISIIENQTAIAFDVCPGNLPLNLFAEKLGKFYDQGGEFARSGKLNESLLKTLNSISYYKQTGPKSLGTEWLEKEFYSRLNYNMSPEDLLRTITEHIAIQIATALNNFRAEKTMITGGGAHNSYLIERICEHFNGNIHLPSNQLIDFKEAIIFAFIGARYLQMEPTTISSVTGARKPVISGVLHLP